MYIRVTKTLICEDVFLREKSFFNENISKKVKKNKTIISWLIRNFIKTFLDSRRFSLSTSEAGSKQNQVQLYSD